MTQMYVCGFMFNEDRNAVILIRKNRPAFQKGKLNGIGGKVEQEDSGVQTIANDWENFAYGSNDEFTVFFFRGSNTEYFQKAKTMETEEVGRFYIGNGVDRSAMANLQWLIPLAVCSEPIAGPVTFRWAYAAAK
jgi:8-oxo-dGTP diphosphatase